MEISVAQKSDSGKYACVATTEAGDVKTVTDLLVSGNYQLAHCLSYNSKYLILTAKFVYTTYFIIYMYMYLFMQVFLSFFIVIFFLLKL